MTLAAALAMLGATFVSVQVGSFTDETRASHVVEELRGQGHDAYFLRVDSLESGESTWKVRVGKFPDNGAARATAEKIKKLGYAGAFPAPTDLVETVGLSSDLTALIAALGSVNPGRVPPLEAGKRLHLYAQDYVTLFLLAADGDPGRVLTDLAVWDTNPDNQPEIFVVIDSARAYVLYWVKDQSRYDLQEVYRGKGVAIGESLDLTVGPEKFIAIRYEQGGDLYLEKGYVLIRWDQPQGSFQQVGKIPLEIADRGEEPGEGINRKRTLEPAKLDRDPDRELKVIDTVVSGKQEQEHLDVWDWNGARVERVTKTEWFEKILAANPDDADAAAGLFGLGIDRSLDGDLEGAMKVFQLLVANHPQTDVAKRSLAVIKEIGSRRERAQILNQAGYDEIRAGAAALATQDLKQAVIQDPGSAHAHYNLAVARTAAGDSLGALRSLRRALDLDPDDAMKIREKARADGDLTALRAHPEFKEILR